jgi:hypothetical protein
MIDYIEELKEGQESFNISTTERIEGVLGLITFGGFCITIISLLT